MPDDRLSISVTHADGRVTRWGPDEVDGKNIPNDLTFSSSVPGGDKDCSCSLLRRLDQDHPDQDLFDLVTVYGSGGRVVWSGRAQQFPRSHGDTYQITPGAVGLAIHLRDNPSFREIYVDRDAGSWHDAPLSRRLRMALVSQPQGKIPVTVGRGGITWSPPNEALPDEEATEVDYDAGPGLAVAALGYRGRRVGAFTGFEAPTLFTNPLENFTGSGASVALTLDDTYGTATVAANRYALLRAYVSTGPVTPAAGHLQSYDAIAVYGSHGVTQRAVIGDLPGLYGSDVIANIVSRAAPLLTFTTGAGGSIEPVTYAVPHLVYRDPVAADFAISDVNKYYLYDWGVYDGEFFWRQPDPDRLCWEARLGDGAHMDADGLTGEQVINGVFVTYPDGVGNTRTVGPPGGSFDATDAALQDTSIANPANSHGIPAKWDNLVLSFPSTLAGATQIGTVYLAERSLATRRGSLTLTGTVQHPTEGKVPVSRVRAGDWVRVTDLNGENASVQRKIIEVSYQHRGSRTASLSLDNTVAKLTSMLERVGVMAGIQSGSGF